jgi:hypothetical protein
MCDESECYNAKEIKRPTGHRLSRIVCDSQANKGTYATCMEEGQTDSSFD